MNRCLPALNQLRPFLLFASAAVFVAVSGQPARAQGWTPVPLRFPYSITGLSFPTPDTGYFVSNRGQIGRTKNGGITWELLTINEAVLEDVFFRTTKIGWAVGRQGTVFYTYTSGETWIKRSIIDSTVLLLSVYACSDNDVIITGSVRTDKTPQGVCYYSSDGGSRWKKAEVSGIQFGELSRVDSKTVSFLSWGQRHVSTDCGKTWTTSLTGDGRPGRLAAYSGKNAIMVGNDGWAEISANGGATWDSVKTGKQANLTCIVMVSPKQAFVGGMGGTMLTTNDAGATWQVEELPFKFDVLDMKQIGRNLIASGSDGKMVRKKLAGR